MKLTKLKLKKKFKKLKKLMKLLNFNENLRKKGKFLNLKTILMNI